jgi:hypothetical protein
VPSWTSGQLPTVAPRARALHSVATLVALVSRAPYVADSSLLCASYLSWAVYGSGRDGRRPTQLARSSPRRQSVRKDGSRAELCRRSPRRSGGCPGQWRGRPRS